MKYNAAKDSGLDSDFRFEKLAQTKNGSIKKWNRFSTKNKIMKFNGSLQCHNNMI